MIYICRKFRFLHDPVYLALNLKEIGVKFQFLEPKKEQDSKEKFMDNYEKLCINESTIIERFENILNYV